MHADERTKRPKLKRTKPIRAWRTPFGPVGLEAVEESTAGGQPQEVIARAVEMGYRVVDEYIRQGQKAARRLAEGNLGAAALGIDWQDAATRMAQLSTEWMGMWFEFAQRAAVDVMKQPPAAAFSAASETSSSEAAASPPTPARVRMEIVSTRPTEVSIDLRPDCTAAPLIVHKLRAVDPALPRLGDLTFTPATLEEPAVLSIRIPTTQPSGTYSGVIVDAASNRPVGTLLVRVAD